MGGTRATYGRQEGCIQGFCEKILRERDHVNGNIILKWILNDLGLIGLD
jgi:hypothetical protein